MLEPLSTWSLSLDADKRQETQLLAVSHRAVDPILVAYISCASRRFFGRGARLASMWKSDRDLLSVEEALLRQLVGDVRAWPDGVVHL